MKSSPHPRSADVFALVVQAPQDARAEILDRECAGDPVLRQEVESLLAHDETGKVVGRPEHPIDGPPLVPEAALDAALAQSAATADPESSDYAAGTAIDQYTIRREIGRGGFGVVYLAEQAPPERRMVALKILEQVALSPRLARRFEKERRAQANLNHPGIAKIYSGGTTAAGHPYFAMEFVAGAGGEEPALRITDYADRHGLSVRQRVELFLLVCHAVQHAHQQGVIHRDLKPTNILVEAGGNRQPKVIDFGLARHIEDGRGAGSQIAHPMLTLSREIVGTPAYMSPEQAAGRHIDTRSDIYSLGVVLYELLCGTLPLPSLLRNAPLAEQLRAICEEEPVRPSRAVLRTAAPISTQRWMDPRRLAKHLRGDLDTILRRLLEKDPARRFASASAIADDLQRYLCNQPIESRPHTLRYTLGKFARRHSAFVVASAIVFFSLVVTVVVSFWALTSMSRERQEAQLVARTAYLARAQIELDKGDGAALGRSLDAVPVEIRGWEWNHLQLLADRSVRRIEGFGGSVSALAMGGSGERFLVGDRHGTTWDAASLPSPTPIVTNPKPPGYGCDVWSVACSPIDDRFATGSFDDAARLHRADGSLLWKVPQKAGVSYKTVYAVAFSPDGRRVAIGGGDPERKLPSFVAFHDVVTGAETWRNITVHTEAVTDLAFSSDRRWLASSADDQTVRLWSLGSNDPELAGTIRAGGRVNTVAFSPNSSLLAAGTTACEIELYHVPSLEPACSRLRGHRMALASVAFHPDGHSLASASWDSTVRLWSVPEGQLLDVLHGHRGRVNRVAFAHDGRLFSASDDGTVREWDPTLRTPMRSVRLEGGAIHRLGVLADGGLVVQYADYHLCIVDSAEGRTRVDLGRNRGDHFAISPGGSTIAWRDADLCVYTWHVDGRAVAHPHPTVPHMKSDVVALNDQHLLIACDEGLLQLDLLAERWDLLAPLPPTREGTDLFSAWLGDDERVLATVWRDGDRGTEWRDRDGQTGYVQAPWAPLSYFCYGRSVVLADPGKRELAVYDNGTGRQAAVLLGHREAVRDVAFSPDTERLASVDDAQTLRIWDWRRSLQVLSIPYPNADSADPSRPASFSAVAWSPNGRTLVTGSTDGVVHYWPSRER